MGVLFGGALDGLGGVRKCAGFFKILFFVVLLAWVMGGGCGRHQFLGLRGKCIFGTP